MLEKLTNISLPISIIVAGLIIAGTFFYLNQTEEKTPEQILSPEKVGEKVINYINKNILTGGNTASLVSITDEGNVYKIRLKIGENEYDSYASKDGRYLFPEGFILEESEEESSTEIPKEEKPDVKLFVMSYCPYGLQAQKMFLPVYGLLKDKAEMTVYFVNYIMHGKEEIDENLNQYCIQKEEKEKYSTYLNCFVVSGDSDRCLSEAAIDKTKLTNCISETDEEYSITSQYNNQSTWLNGRYPKFDVYTELNEQYNVVGSPTVIINDQIVEVSPRSPEQFKETICLAFNSPPEECSQALSESVPAPGIGGGTGSSSGGSCQ